MEAMPGGALYIFFLSPFFLGITNVLGHSGIGSSNLMSEVEVVALYKKVSPRPCDYTVTTGDEE